MMINLEKIRAQKLAKKEMKKNCENFKFDVFESRYGYFFYKSTINMTIIGFLAGLYMDVLSITGLAHNSISPMCFIVGSVFGWIMSERYKMTIRNVYYHK